MKDAIPLINNSGWANNIPVSRYSYMNVYETTKRNKINSFVGKKNCVRVRACKLELSGSWRLAISNQRSRSPDCSYAGARGSNGSLVVLIANCPLSNSVVDWNSKACDWSCSPPHHLAKAKTQQKRCGGGCGWWCGHIPPLPLSWLVFKEQKVMKRGVEVGSQSGPTS